MNILARFFKLKQNVLSPEQLTEYRELCEEVSALVDRHGKTVRPYLDTAFSRLRAHPRPELVLKCLRGYRDIILATEKDGSSPSDDRRFVWKALLQLGLRPPSDLMDSLEAGDTIQIYSTENLLMFFNLRFFEYIDATIDEIFTIVWDRDSKRDMKVTAEALRLVFLIRTRRLRKTFRPQTIPAHSATFTFSGVTQKIELELKIAAPLFGAEGMSAYLISQHTRRLSV